MHPCLPVSLHNLLTHLRGHLLARVHRRLADLALPLLAVLLVILGVQFVVMGLLAELTTRTYYETQGLRVYRVREVVGREAESSADWADLAD